MRRCTVCIYGGSRRVPYRSQARRTAWHRSSFGGATTAADFDAFGTTLGCAERGSAGARQDSRPLQLAARRHCALCGNQGAGDLPMYSTASSIGSVTFQAVGAIVVRILSITIVLAVSGVVGLPSVALAQTSPRAGAPSSWFYGHPAPTLSAAVAMKEWRDCIAVGAARLDDHKSSDDGCCLGD
jgi:hypothetical protein